MAEGPFAFNHLLYSFSGALPSGEIWSVGLRTLEAMTVPPDLQGFADQASDAFIAFWNSTGSIKVFNPNTVTFASTVVRQISTAGLTLWQAEKTTVPPTAGAGAGQNAPNQTALVVTTRSAVSGRSGRGRFYLPLLTPILQAADGRLRPADTAAIAGQSATLLGAIGLITSSTGPVSSGPFRVAIQSRVAGKGQAEIIRVAVGNVCDTQRRRRDKEIEIYANANVESP